MGANYTVAFDDVLALSAHYESIGTMFTILNPEIAEIEEFPANQGRLDALETRFSISHFHHYHHYHHNCSAISRASHHALLSFHSVLSP